MASSYPETYQNYQKRLVRSQIEPEIRAVMFTIGNSKRTCNILSSAALAALSKPERLSSVVTLLSTGEGVTNPSGVAPVGLHPAGGL